MNQSSTEEEMNASASEYVKKPLGVPAVDEPAVGVPALGVPVVYTATVPEVPGVSDSGDAALVLEALLEKRLFIF